MNLAAAIAAVLAALALASCRGNDGGWTTADYRDPTNAEIIRTAETVNKPGYAIRIFRSGDLRVRWLLSIPESSFDRLAKRGRVASIRVDNLSSNDLNVTTSTFVEQPVVSGTYIRSLLWHGEGASPTRGTLRNVLDGNSLAVRFYLDSGTFADTTFSLAGASQAIADALGIDANVDPAIADMERTRDSAILNAGTMCMAAPNVAKCAGVLAECMGGDLASLTEDALRQCMSDRGYPFR